MAERLSELQGVQIGVETTPGTAVPANKKLQYLTIPLSPAATFDEFGPQGSMFQSDAEILTEETNGTLAGRMTYTEIAYVLSSIWGPATITTPASATNARQWEWIPNISGPNNGVSFTVERGDGTTNERATNVRIGTLSFTIDDRGVTLGGTAMGSAMAQGITLTATPALIPATPAQRKQFSVYMDPMPGSPTLSNIDSALGTTKFTRLRSAGFSINDRYSPFYAVDAANGTSPATRVERKGRHEGTITIMRNAVGVSLWTAAQAGSAQLFRIEGVGSLIEHTTIDFFYKVTLDFIAKVVGGGGIADDNGSEVSTFTLRPIVDTNWTKAVRLRLITSLTAL